MKLLIGLGNPGKRYEATRHNVGFMAVDELVHQEGASYDKALFDASFTQVLYQGQKALIMKPLTFMNLSGNAIRPLMNYFNIALEDICVIYDDMDLPVGKIRLRQKGSAGGHNGIKSMIECLGSNEFKRIKVGVGRPQAGRSVTNHVLSRFDKEEEDDLILAVERAVDAAKDWIKGGDFAQTMNRYNQ